MTWWVVTMVSHPLSGQVWQGVNGLIHLEDHAGQCFMQLLGHWQPVLQVPRVGFERLGRHGDVGHLHTEAGPNTQDSTCSVHIYQ